MKQFTLKTKLLLFGVLISAIPILVSLFFSVMNNRRIQQMAVEETLKLGHSDLMHIVQNINVMAVAQNGLAQEMINNALKTARNTLEETGKVSFSVGDTVIWHAINQFTKESKEITLPKMMIGSEWLGQIGSFNSRSMVVDKTRDLAVETCTLFQRMNEAGDMLRVATNVKKLDGTRAIGTYIPAMNPNGTANTVISSIIAGDTFKGRAYVVNAWYLTAYEPIYDKKGEVTGILYVGIKQHTVEKSLIDKIAKIGIGNTGYVTVLNSKGEYIVSKNNERDGDRVWESKDSQGHYYIQDIIKKAHALDPKDIATYRYHHSDNGGNTHAKLVKLKYYKTWDWIIAAEVNEKELLSIGEKIVHFGKKTIIQYSLVAASIIALAILISFLFSKSITQPINHIIKGLSEGSDQAASASDQVSSASQSLAEGSSEQAASIEETASSLEEMSSMIKQNADNSHQTDNLIKASSKIVEQANLSMEKVTISMEEISTASEETSNIIKTIDEIAFQTNLLALNAAVEAARAGDAGAGFAVVADEVRNLAMRAAEAARDTAGLIEGTVHKVNEGATLVTGTNDAFIQVADSFSKFGKLIEEIAAASNEQAQGIQQINTAISEMEDVTQRNAANAEESASASTEMRSQAEKMKSIVGELISIVGRAEKNQVTSQLSISKSE